MKNVKRILNLLIIGLFVTLCITLQGYADGHKVNINTASKEQLMTLKGVGGKIADRILEYRTAHPFKQPADIMNVKGIGQKVYENNKERIIVKNE